MDFDKLPFAQQSLNRADIYTNLQGLQGIKNEENKGEALKKVAQQFESLFVQMMMKSMREANAVFEEDSLFSSKESNFYRDMLDKQQSLSLAHRGGLGIAEALYRQMSRDYGDNPTQLEAGKIQPLNHTESVKMPVSSIVDKSALDKRSSMAESPLDFVEKLVPLAKKAAGRLGVDHLLLVAQSALETGWGRKMLSDEKGGNSHNLFNIKVSGDWQKSRAHHNTLEFKNGVVEQENAAFRVYDDLAESLSDYVSFVKNSERYKSAVESVGDAKAYIQALHKAGYATDPNYSEKVMSVYSRVKDLAQHLQGSVQS